MRIICIILFCSAVMLGADAPTGLLCELIPTSDAVRISDPKPEFSWMVNPAAEDSIQTAYQIIVATSPTLLVENLADAWDSGVVNSAQSVAVEYQGKALAPGRTMHWKVRTYDSIGISSWSDTQHFIMADTNEKLTTPRLPLTTTRVAPMAVKDLGDHQWLIDFGRDAAGWLELEIESPIPGNVDVHLGEKITRDHHVDQKPGGTIRHIRGSLVIKPGRHTYRVDIPPNKKNTTGHALAVALPKEFGVVIPFRYAEIKGLSQAPLATQVAVHYPFDERAARFSSSDSTLNAVWDFCRYSIKATSYCGLYIDGDRERIPYEADAYINQLSHYGVDREYAMARATYDHLLDHPTWPTEWAQHMVLMAWADWMYTGDRDALARSYKQLVEQKSLRSRMRADGLLDTTGMRDIVDWPAVERDHYILGPVNTVVNAFHYRVQVCLADIAQALDKDDDAALFMQDAERIRQAVNAKLFDPTKGLYVDGEGISHVSLHANMFPLAFGLVPEERKAAVVTYIKQRGMACSVYGAQYLLEGLFAAGEADHAIELMATKGKRGWWNMMVQGTTITLESWELSLKPNMDWNHAWGSAPANIVPRFVLGVQPLAPGFAHMRIRPQVGHLAHVEGTVPTIRGSVSVVVDQAVDGKQTVDVIIPGNTRARVEIDTYSEEVGPGRHLVRQR